MALISTTGTLAGSYSYDPYGKTTATNGTSTTAAQNNPWRYTGGYQDPTDNYYHFGARYYDTAGHFTSADNIAGNIGRAEKYNSYTYTAGDPVNSTDLSGQISYSAGIGIALGVIGVAAFFAVALLAPPAGVAFAAASFGYQLGIIGGIFATFAGVGLSILCGFGQCR